MSKDWLKVYDQAIPTELCDRYIQLFDDDVTSKTALTESYRRCLRYYELDSLPIWGEFTSLISKLYTQYKQDVQSGTLGFANTVEVPCFVKYEVDRIDPNAFHTHADAWNSDTCSRVVSIIMYLNDVTEGGGTTFPDLNLTVTPRKGQVLMFPAFLTYPHMGVAPVSNSKYIIVTWIHFDGCNYKSRVHRL